MTRIVYGEPVERNARIYSIEPTPYYATHRPPVSLRLWGEGHWCVANGQACHYPTDEAAHEAGQIWIETGLQPADQNEERIARRRAALTLKVMDR